MLKARLVITAVILEHRPVTEVACDYGVAISLVAHSHSHVTPRWRLVAAAVRQPDAGLTRRPLRAAPSLHFAPKPEPGSSAPPVQYRPRHILVAALVKVHSIWVCEAQ